MVGGHTEVDRGQGISPRGKKKCYGARQGLNVDSGRIKGCLKAIRQDQGGEHIDSKKRDKDKFKSVLIAWSIEQGGRSKTFAEGGGRVWG